MARSKKKPVPPPPQNRITVEAQGGGTQESERWSHPQRSPTIAEVLDMLTKLEARLTANERQARQQAFDQARAYIPQIAASGYSAPPPLQHSFPQPALQGGIRVDLNIFSGRIVP
jgi:hypothetical protein